jgi:cell division protein FtsW
MISAGGTSTATTLLVLGIITNAARHEPEAVAALRAGRDDRMNRLLRLPLPEPYVPTRLEAARDRLRTRTGKPAPDKAKPKPKPKLNPKAKTKPKTKASGNAKNKAKPNPARKPAEDRRRNTVDAGDRAARGSGHHGGGQRQPSRGARTLEGQRYG